MSDTREPPHDWGGKTEWQSPRSGSGQPTYNQPAHVRKHQAPHPPWATPVGAPAIQTHLVPAILAALLCIPTIIGIPAGIAAIVFAIQASSKRNTDYSGAVQASKRALVWTIISFAIAAVIISCYVIASAASQNSGYSG